MNLSIFNVEHGACALLTCDDKTRMMIDCGTNSTTKWSPASHLLSYGIDTLEMLVITNYDEDHAAGAVELFDRIDVQWLWRNKSVSTDVLMQLKTETGMGKGIKRLCHEIDNVFGDGGSSSGPTFSGLERTAFKNDYPTFKDENNLSLALFLECNGVRVLFPGDLERAGWLKLLENQAFVRMLSDVRVFVASHHGRQNGCCEEVMRLCTSLNYVVISDHGYQYDTQQTIPFYRRFAAGGPFRADANRRVLTTRRDGAIHFSFGTNNWGPY